MESAISAGFIGGYDDGSFKPQKQVTRGEVAAMLVKAIPPGLVILAPQAFLLTSGQTLPLVSTQGSPSGDHEGG